MISNHVFLSRPCRLLAATLVATLGLGLSRNDGGQSATLDTRRAIRNKPVTKDCCTGDNISRYGFLKLPRLQFLRVESSFLCGPHKFVSLPKAFAGEELQPTGFSVTCVV